MKSKKFENSDCKNKVFKFKENKYMVGTLRHLTKEGNLDMYNKTKRKQHALADAFDDGNKYDVIDIDEPFLKPKNKEGPMNEGQKEFKRTVRAFMNGDTMAFVLKSRYGSGKTTFMQRLIKEHNHERVLFITYRQTLALDIMRNFGRLQFKNYLDACSDPSIWDAPRLDIQIDSLMKHTVKRWVIYEW